MSIKFPCSGHQALHAPTRREFVYGLGASVGSLALTSFLAPALQAAQKAKNCIFLMMEGGPSHIDTFDPKPKLAELHLKDLLATLNDAHQSHPALTEKMLLTLRRVAGAGMVAEQPLITASEDFSFFAQRAPVG